MGVGEDPLSNADGSEDEDPLSVLFPDYVVRLQDRAQALADAGDVDELLHEALRGLARETVAQMQVAAQRQQIQAISAVERQREESRGRLEKLQARWMLLSIPIAFLMGAILEQRAPGHPLLAPSIAIVAAAAIWFETR